MGLALPGARHDPHPFTMGLSLCLGPLPEMEWLLGRPLSRALLRRSSCCLASLREQGVPIWEHPYIWLPGPSFRKGQVFKLVPLSGNHLSSALCHGLPRLGSGRFKMGPALEESWGPGEDNASPAITT